ncbi:hypothetical protein [Sphingomonas sp. 22R3R2A-7]|uniref:hypothetical protein n=1 Tax=Sphingomonas sp. 22R3R2A-7 TaxID=3050230 RepID=UPI002FE31745
MPDERLSLRIHRDNMMSTGIGWVRRVRRFQKWINVGCVLGGALVSGIGGGMEGPMVPALGSGILTLKGLLVCFGAAVVFLGGLALLIIQDEAPELLARAAALEGQAQQFLDERDGLTIRLEGLGALDRRRLELIDANRTMREALEQTLLIPEADALGAAQGMIDLAGRYLISSIGFETGEAWAISIFRVEADNNGDGDGEILNRIAALRAEKLDERRQPRSWRRNEGFVGAAWVSNRDTIIEDCHEPRVAADYPVPPGCRREYDADRYRSMAVIPIRLGADRRVWGLVAASTDRIGRFRRDPGNRQVQTVDTVRLIARMTGLMAAAFERAGN